MNETLAATRITDQEFAVEVDTALAAMWEVESDLVTPVRWAVDAVFRATGLRRAGEKQSRWETPKPEATLAEALQSIRSIIEAIPRNDRPYEAWDAEKVEATYTEARAKMDEVREAQEPFNAEYREARWTRAFLVLNAGGHVHSSRACSTCFYNTRFGWLPEVSGMDEAQIVEMAGESACTVCYPSAPVASLSQPRRMFHQTEIEAQAAREKRAAEKAERDAKKAAKAIANPDGSPLVAKSRWSSHREVLETAATAKSWLTDSQESWAHGFTAEEIQQVAEALAHKFGTTPEAEIAAAAKRAAKRR